MSGMAPRRSTGHGTPAALLIVLAPSSAGDGLEELHAKIVRHPEDGKWSDVGKAFVMATWDDYNKAHLSTGADPP